MAVVSGSTGSGISTRNPLFDEFIFDWRQMRDTYRGERVVKEEAFLYLPPTSGMKDDGLDNVDSPGFKAYTAYKSRARYPDFVRESVESMLGVMHHKPPVIALPKKMEPLRERGTLRNESLEMLLRRINEEQLIMGRLGLLLEVPEFAAAAAGVSPAQILPLIAVYHAERLINWDEGERDLFTEVEALNLVVIDETELERRHRFSWERIEKHRVLILGDPFLNEPEGDPNATVPTPQGRYRVGVFRQKETFREELLVTPAIAGRELEFIPFVFVNTKDVTPFPDEPPLLGLSNLSLTVYRGEADYRQSLFMQGQDTLVTIGATTEEGDVRRTGAGASIDLNIGGDAKYIGVDSTGLSEQRLALENDYDRGNAKASALLESVGAGAESGEALRVRVAARTASLNQVALTGAFALQSILRMAATWVGADPDEVVVEPNLDFVADIMSGQELTQYMAAKGLGAPIALQTIHEGMQDRGLTTLTWDEEIERLEAEAEAGLPGATATGEKDESGTADPEVDPNAEDDETETETEEEDDDA